MQLFGQNAKTNIFREIFSNFIPVRDYELF